MAKRERIVPNPRNMKRVYDVGAPNVQGTIVSNEDISCETAEVKWDHHEPWGQRGFHIKRYLRVVGDSPITLNDKVIFMNAEFFAIMDMSRRIDKVKTFDRAKSIVRDSKRTLSIYAVTKAGAMTLIMKSLWEDYDKLMGVN